MGQGPNEAILEFEVEGLDATNQAEVLLVNNMVGQ